MGSLQERAKPAVEELLRSDEEQLYQRLGLTAEAMKEDPTVAAAFSSKISNEGLEGIIPDGVSELGRRNFARWNREAHQLICGKGQQDEQDRQNILAAFASGEVAVGAALATMLVTSFGLSAAVAAIVSAIVMKRFFSPAYEEFCNVWGEHLE